MISKYTESASADDRQHIGCGGTVRDHEPQPVVIIYVLLSLGFVIYIPVALFRSNIFLLVQDVLLYVAFIFTLARDRGHWRIFGGDAIVTGSIGVFLLGVALGAGFDPFGMTVSTAQGVRSLLFGIFVLLLSSIWFTTPERVDKVLKIILIGSVLAAMYGVRQFIWGLLPFELERLASMGSSVAEIEHLGRQRIPSTYGDPGAFSFMMMIGAMSYLMARRRKLLPKLTLWGHPWILLLILFGLGMTLTRACMLGLAVALLIRFFFHLRWTLYQIVRLFFILSFLSGILYCVGVLVLSETFANAEIQGVRHLNNIMIAVWTLLPGFMSGESTVQLETLRTLSASSRLGQLIEGVKFLLINPLGGGCGSLTVGGLVDISISPTDVGVLRYGLEAGWFGLLGFIGIFAGVAIAARRKILRAIDERTRSLGLDLLALWGGIGVSIGISSFLHTETLSLVVWILGGIMLNLDQVSIGSRTFR